MARINSAAGLENPLQDVFPKPVIAQRAPTSNDRNYVLGQVWIDEPSSQVYALTNTSGGTVTWTLTGPGASDVDTLTGDTGGAISPAGGNINILGGDGLTVAGAGSTLTINRDAQGGYPITPYVVGPSGQAGYTTIQAALDAANAAGGGMVFVQPGTYTENLTLYDGTQIIGAVGLGDLGALVIDGVHTPPTTGSFIMRNCRLVSATDIFSSAAAGTSTILIIDIAIAVTNGYVFDLPNWAAPGGFAAFDVAEIGSTNCGWVNNTGGATVFMTNITMGAGSANSMITTGFVELYNCVVQCPVDLQTGSNGIVAGGTVFENTITFSNNSTLDIYNTAFTTGANAAILYSSSGNSTLSNVTINSSNSPAITGAGAGNLSLTGVDFISNPDLAGTLTIVGGLSKSGELEATTGNIYITQQGGELQVMGGTADDFIGEATLVAGTVTIANVNISANDRILIQRRSINGSTTLGSFTYSIIAATSFTITAVQPASPGMTETNDTSIVSYFIVREL